MKKKYIILEHTIGITEIYKNCFFNDKKDAERIAAELNAEYENPNDYNEVKELNLYHETDEDFIEPED